MPSSSSASLPPVTLHARTAATALIALSNDDSIQYILADIPFFAVGLLAFGIFTFFLVMRRINVMVLCLHISAFLAFVAAILDLSQNLVRGREATNSGQNTNSVIGLIVVREIGFSLAVGLRFLFFWFYVARVPAGEEYIPGELHSGSWRRWGILGTFLQWFTAVICLVIPILQILHRTVSSLHMFSGVYEVESTLEIIISVVFILKLFLNVYLCVISKSPDEPRWKALQSYTAVILALVLSAAVGVGSVALFQFSETVLGRFLQGIMFYVLLVYIIIYTFYDFREDFIPDASGLRLNNRSNSFRGLPSINHSTFHISPPMVSVESIVGRSNSRRPSNFSRNSVSQKSQKEKPTVMRRSNPSRLSNLLVSRGLASRIVSPNDEDGDKLWNQDEAEKGMSPHVTFQYQESDAPALISPEDQSPTGPKESAKWQDPVFTSVLKESANDVPRSVSPRPPIPLPALTIPARAVSRSETPVLLGYNDSPIFGLDGIIRGQGAQPTSQVRQPPSDRNEDSSSSSNDTRVSSISYLLRQQAELDKSIANLRLLNESDNVIGRRGSETSSEGKLPSASQSEFSLSNFPEPPWGSSNAEAEITRRAGTLPTVTALRQAASLKVASKESLKPAPSEPLPPPPPVRVTDHSRSLSVPYSDIAESSAMGRDRSTVDSLGTQYEITSFIGGFSHPGHKQASSSISFGTSPNESSLSEGPGEMKITSRLDSKPVPTRSNTLPEGPRLGPGAGRGTFVGTGTGPMQRRSLVGLPPRPKLGVVGVLSPLSESSSAGEYERPRPAPHPSTSRGPSP